MELSIYGNYVWMPDCFLKDMYEHFVFEAHKQSCFAVALDIM
jgi:hypothetical protein